MSKMVYGICRNCSRYAISRPRKLCWTCYYTPGVKERFPKETSDAFIVDNTTKPLPKEPTMARPGTEEKIQVFRERIMRGEHLHHPDDYKGD